MKKIKGMLMCLIILLYNIGWAIPVIAEELANPVLKIIDIKQGDNSLNKVDGKYVINGYDYIILNYEIDNYDISKNYSINVLTSTGGSGFSDNSRLGSVELSSILNNSGEYEVTIKLCSDYECSELYSSTNLKFNFDLDEYKNNASMNIVSVSQGDKTVSKQSFYQNTTYSLNPTENVQMCIKTNNLNADVDYKLTYSYDSTLIKGSVLNSGYCVNFYPSINQVNSIELYRDDFLISKLYDSENAVYFNYDSSGTYPNFNYEISYDYDNSSISPEDIMGFENVYSLNSSKVDKDNSITMQINGSNYDLSTDFNIQIDGYYYDNKVYTKTLTKKGSELSNGINIDLLTYLPEFIKDYETYDVPNVIYITIGNVKKKVLIRYSSSDLVPTVKSTIFYEDGKKNLSTFRGNGGFNWDGGIADTNKLAFSKYSSIYLNYIGENFYDSETYDYIFEYGHMVEHDSYSEFVTDNVLSRGSIKGSVLNTVGSVFKVDNSGNYNMPFYRYTVKKGDEVLFSSVPTLDLVDNPTLANVSLKANNKNLYLQTSDDSYTATRNAGITANIAGIGFEDNKTYELTISSTVDDDWENSEEVKMSFTGYELNNGKAIYTYNKSLSNVNNLQIYVYGDIEYNGKINSVQGGFDINFVDSKDLFPTNTKYVIDNGLDIIKNISKLTDIVDFTNELILTNNGKLKIYKNGVENTSGNIGTGMTATVTNEYDEKVIDMDIVVKGDVTGDGEISITDLVKVADHVAEVKELDGVYEMAGNVTDSGEISITDLVKIADDVAGIKELN